MRVTLLVGAASLAAFTFSACGSHTTCTVTPIHVTVVPAMATADHAAVPPGNQVQFTATIAGGDAIGCALNVSGPHWVSFDDTIAQVDQSGVATCLQTSSTPVRIQASAVNGMVNGSGSGTLTCN